MLNKRKKSRKTHNKDLVFDYLENYEKVGKMYGAYRNYASLLLSWADDRDLLRAPRFRIDFSEYLYNKGYKNGKQYSDNYVYSSCLFVRDFFRYCKAILPDEDTKLITEHWMKNLVPHRSSAKRLSFTWINDENLLKIMRFPFEQDRLRRAQAAILLSSVTGMSRAALLSIPIKEIDFNKLLAYQYPERGVCTEKLASGITHILPDEEIVWFLRHYTEGLKKVSPEDCTWFIRYSRHGVPQPAKFGQITEDNQNEAYKFALAPYGRLQEDLVKISEACNIPKVTLSIAQNTYIHKRLLLSNDQESVDRLVQDLLLKDPAPIKQCLKLLDS